MFLPKHQLQVVVIILAAIIIWLVFALQAAKRFSPNAPQTRLEELSLYAGKTDEELRSLFGEPDTTAWQSVAEPDDLSEAEQKEWWKNTTVYILRYGNINVEENQDHEILRVYADK
jgi:hypothetical protein